MTKAEIVNRINEKTGIEKVAVMAIVEEVMASIKENMANGENVYLRGFGTFEIKRKALRHFNYAPGKMRIIPEHCEPSFKPSKEFKESVKEGVKA